MGLSRPARGGEGRTGPRHLGTSGDHRVRHRQVQRCLSFERARVHQRLARLRHPPGSLGRLRQRLQDARPLVHGERHVGVQDALGQRTHLRGLPRAGLLLALRDTAQQHRDTDGRHLPRSPGSGAHGGLRARDRRAHSGVDDHTVDVAVEPGARSGQRHRVRGRRTRRRALHHRRRPARRVRRRTG